MPPTDTDPAGSLSTAAYRPAGILYLACCLAGLAIGLWPEAVLIPHGEARAGALWVLGALAIGQVLFGLLVWPLVVLRRSQRGILRRYWLPAAAEWSVYLVLAIPFYVVGAYLSDAAVQDVVRTAFYVVCVWTAPLAAGAYLAADRPGRSAVMLALVLAALALPAGHYVTLEFATRPAAEFLGRISAPEFAFGSAAPRAGRWFPQPLWAALVWPVAAAVAALIGMLISPRRPLRGSEG